MTDPREDFHQHRPHLYGIAYRMLGSRSEAEDMVQEAYLRWHGTELERVQKPRAWLTTTVTRLCIDRLRAVRSERERYVGPWLPEPVVAAPGSSPEELASDLSVAFLMLLERLAPEERAAFLLHDVFDSDYAEIARVLNKTSVSCRQLVHRARERVHRDRPRFQVSDEARARLLGRLLGALRAQDHETLLSLFAADATWTSDGGGLTRAARKVVRGHATLVRFASGIWRLGMHRMDIQPRQINGELGLVVLDGPRLHSVLTIDTDGERILAVYAILSPDKLAHIEA